MKLTINAGELSDMGGLLAVASSGVGMYDYLEHLLLRATPEGKLELSTTNLDVTLREVRPAVRVDEPGQALVRARMLSDICRQLPPEGLLALGRDGFGLTLKCGGASSRILGLDPDSFPS